jgi:hypothetical protein
MKTLHRTCTLDKVATSVYMFGRRCEVEKNLPFCKFMEVVRNMNLVMTVEKKDRNCAQGETILAHLYNLNT